MWRRTHPQRAENDEGVSVESAGRFSDIYSDGVREMSFRREVGVDADDKTVYHILWQLPLKWNPPHENEIVTDEEAQKIRTNLSEALAFKGVRAIFSK
jgi:hypothetical protein